MKKLMLTVAACVALAFGAKADMPGDAIPEGAQNVETTDYGVRYDYQEGETIYTVDIYTKTGESTWQVQDGVTSFDFLVVGGGGGGTRAGGGGGGMAIGTLGGDFVGKDLSIVVGVGGNANAGDGGYSSVSSGETTYVKAFGGGAGGVSQNVDGTQHGKDGGSGGGGGSRYNKNGIQKNTNGGQVIPAVFADGVIGTSYGNAGGGCTVDYAAGPGGGAGAAGEQNKANSDKVGGAGRACDITGKSVYYAGGGNGGGNKKSGAPVAAAVGGGGLAGINVADYVMGGNGVDGLGGGGGGAYTASKAGKGGSGVVIIRYAYKKASSLPVAVPSIAGKAYTGETLTADIDETDEYEVVENNGGVNAGTYPVVLRLKAHDPKYVWDDGEESEGDKTLGFVISKAANSWATAPALSKTAWRYSDEPATVTAGVSAQGETAAVTYDDGQEEMPTSVGGHTATFTVAASDNYEKLETVIGYTINKDANAWTVEPSLTKTTWVFGEVPGEIVAGTAKYGDVGVTYEDNPVLTELPTSLGEHWVTFTVNDGDTYEALSKKVYYTVTKKINGWATPPVVSDGNIEDGLPEFTPPTAMSGGDVTVYYDGNPEITEPPTAMGNHSVTYTVAEDQSEEDYQGYTQTIAYKVTYKMVYDQANPSVVAGYRLPGLGANSNEVAVVFTNTTAGAMTFALPKYVSEIFYLVVGGGASGGHIASNHGAGGGGAGGVVTNVGPAAVSGGATLKIAVGAGGASVTANAAGNDGKPSRLEIGEKTYVADGGGGGGAQGQAGRDGGCGGGAGGYATSSGPWSGGTGSQGYDGGLAGKGNRGGGGGGAGSAGGDYNVSHGPGGEGIQNDITGSMQWYAAGGGGSGTSNNGYGAGGKGGGGVGSHYVSNASSYNAGSEAGSGTTYGSGGGGASHNQTRASGAGHQGIVVVRYVEAANLAVMPAIPETMYSGERQVAQLVGGQGFEVVANEGGVEAGTNDVVIALAEGYSAWEDGVTDAERTLGFVINKADHNEWNPEPSISKDTWTTTDEEPGVLTAGRTTFGPVTATYTRNGEEQGEFDGTLPTKTGTYVISYTAPDETDSYVTVAEEDRVKTVEFMIVMENAVAKVGDYDTYETVADAFAAAKDGDTVLMLQNATVDAAVEVTNDVTLVLAGYEISADGRDPDTLFVVKDGAVFTLDGSAEGSLLAGGVCVESGTLNLANTTIVAAGDAIVAGSEGGVTLNLGEGNEVTSTEGYAIRETYADVEATAVHAITVTGGSYSGELGTFVATAAFDAAMEAGTATCAFEKASYTKPIDAKYVAVGHLQKKLADGTYCIGPAADTEALTYTWNGNGDTNLWQTANWSINKDLAPDAYVGFPNSKTYATAEFAAQEGGSPIRAVMSDDAAIKILNILNGAPAITLDLGDNTLDIAATTKQFYSTEIGRINTTYSMCVAGNDRFNLVGGTCLTSGGAIWAQGNDIDIVISNATFASNSTGASGSGRILMAIAPDTSAVRGLRYTVTGGAKVSGSDVWLHLTNNPERPNELVAEGEGSKISLSGPGGAFCKNARWYARKGGSLVLGTAHLSIGGDGGFVCAEGEGSTAKIAQVDNDTYNNITAKNQTWAAVDGGALTFEPGGKAFKASGSADVGNRFVASNGTISVSRAFGFGIHTNDTDCVSPTIALAGNSPKFSTSCAFTFGSAAMELAKPPVLELKPAPGGFAEPAISTSKKDYSLTIGSNVVVRVDVSDLKAHGAVGARMVLAAVPADGTGELKVDLDQLAANTTFNDEKADWRVTYKLSERNGRKVLTARITSGGFAVIIR